GYLPAGPSYGNNFFLYEKSSQEQIKTLRYEVDESYIGTLGMTMKQGSNFTGERGSDSLSIILNETAVKDLGWTGNVIGKNLSTAVNSGKVTTYQVRGVIKDFHFRSLHEKISPLVMTYNKDFGQLIVKVKTKEVAGVIDNLKSVWNGMNQDRPFEYSFLDEQFSNTYHAEQNTGRILGIFAGLTIFVACLGLFGLATFTVRQRNKEIGIRKVLGATVSSIVLLLSRDFIKLVFIAFVVAAPVSWFLMNKWLMDFEYRVDVALWIFGAAAMVAILITVATVGFRGLRAALINPSEVLKNE
ncbi:MAG: FtsX-like permease family protein, partial [Chitinophagaceae bacterium]